MSHAVSPDPSLFLDVEVGSPERGARRFAVAGKVLYMEFPSADIERAQRFWSGVLGWRFGSGLREGFEQRAAAAER
jgi:hypothetical protein